MKAYRSKYFTPLLVFGNNITINKNDKQWACVYFLEQPLSNAWRVRPINAMRAYQSGLVKTLYWSGI